MVFWPRILDPENRFPGSYRHSAWHIPAADACCPNVIQPNVEPSIDYDAQTLAERPVNVRDMLCSPYID